MKTSFAVIVSLLVASSLFAQGVYNLAKQQAKNAAASENRNQQAIESSGQSPTAPPSQNNPPPDPMLQATLRNISNLRADFDDLASGRTNTVAFQNDLKEAAQGTRPAPAAVTKLADDLAAVVSNNKKLQEQQKKLAQFVHALFNSSHLSAVQQQTVLDLVQKILSDGGVSADDSAKVITDLKAIATATK